MNPLRETPHPLLIEIPARLWLRALSRDAGRGIRLGDVPDAPLDELARRGFQGVWLMGAWRTGAAGRALALAIPELRREYERVLPDWEPRDVAGSPYAVAAYEVAEDLGGDDALAAFRERLAARGIALVLDFVPNHVARDHCWLDDHPQRFVRGTPRDLARDPGNWFVHTTRDGEDRVFAHGRDPWFPGWTDTAQLDHRRPETRAALIATLLDVAARCDGLRCDMAMLVLPDVFRSTWGDEGSGGCFWTEAIAELRRARPETLLVAEAYWGLEERLRGLGFDATYDKELYDRLVARDVGAVRERSARPGADQTFRVRFLENHDEPRALATFGPGRLPAAAAAVYALPGVRFFFAGQAEGRRARVPVQLARAPREPDDPACLDFHERLFALLARDTLHHGAWTPLERLPGGDGVVGSRWASATETVVVAANLGDAAATVRVPLDLPAPDETVVLVEDLAGGDHFRKFAKELREVGLERTIAGGGVGFLLARPEGRRS